MAERPITPDQIRAIKTAQRRVGLDDDVYRAGLEARYGVRSCTELTRRQATDLLTRLGRPLPTRTRKPRPERLPPGATRLATGEQRRLIAELAGEIEWGRAAGYEGWLRSSMRLDRVATSQQASRVIQGLRAIRERRRGGG